MIREFQLKWLRSTILMLLVFASVACQPQDPPVGRNRQFADRKVSEFKYNGTLGLDYVYAVAYRLREIRTIMELGLAPAGSITAPAGCGEAITDRQAANHRLIRLSTDNCNLARLQKRSDLTLRSFGQESLDVFALPNQMDVIYDLSYQTVGDIRLSGEIKSQGKEGQLSASEERHMTASLVDPAPQAQRLAPVKAAQGGALQYRVKYAVKITSHQELGDRSVKIFEDGQQWIDIDAVVSVESGKVTEMLVARAELLSRAPREVENRTRKKADKLTETTHHEVHMVLQAAKLVNGSKKVDVPLAFAEGQCAVATGQLGVLIYDSSNPNDRLKGRGTVSVNFTSAGVELESHGSRGWYQCSPKLNIKVAPWWQIRKPAQSLIEPGNRLANWNPYSAILFK